MLERTIALAALTSALAIGCGAAEKRRAAAAGEDALTENRPVEPFDRIEISGSLPVIVTQGKAHRCEVSGDREAVAAVDAKVREGALRLELSKPIGPGKGVEIRVRTPKLLGIAVSGAGAPYAELSGGRRESLEISLVGAARLEVKGISAGSLEVKVEGGGGVDAQGEAAHLEFELSGLGKSHFENLCVGTAKAVVRGAGGAVINASKRLEATIVGTGSVRYLGSPDIVRDVSGIGKVVKADDDVESTCP